MTARFVLTLKAEQLGLFGSTFTVSRKRVQQPGSRGSTKWWVDQHGQIRYDERPQPDAGHAAEPAPAAAGTHSALSVPALPPPPPKPPPEPALPWRRVRTAEELAELSQRLDTFESDPQYLLQNLAVLVQWQPTPFGRTPNAVEWARRMVARAFDLPQEEGWRDVADPAYAKPTDLFPEPYEY